VEQWRKKEPVALLRKRLLREKIVEEQELARVEERVQKEIVDAASSAIASPEASMDSILLDVYA
jgi:TPP-dependent pyruvate/acetoin dehydrogenase alpha subunit